APGGNMDAPAGASRRRATLMGRPLPDEPGRGRAGRGNREVPPDLHQRRGLAGEKWFPPRERAEGERRSCWNSQIRLDDGLVRLYLSWSPFCDLLAEVEHVHTVGDSHDKPHVVLDEQDRQLEVAVHAPHERPEPLDLVMAEPSGRFIE